MIKIIKLNEANGSDRFGSCSLCGVCSGKDKTLMRITFMNDNQGTSICLCSKCANMLFDALKERGGVE